MHISYSFVFSVFPKHLSKILKRDFVDSIQLFKKQLARYPNNFSKLISFLLLFYLAIPLQAQDDWVYATGLSYGSNITPEEGWKRALDDARSEAIIKALGIEVRQETFGTSYEKTGTIDTAEYGEIFSTLSRSTTSGRIVKEEIIEQIPEFKNNVPIYKTTIRAMVDKEVGVRDPNFQLELLLDRDVYYDRGSFYKNDEINFSLWSNQNCYFYLFNFMSNDSVQLLIPNKYVFDNFYSADDNGKNLKEKIKNSSMKFRVKLPYNREAVSEALYLVAVKEKVDFTSKNFTADGENVIPTYKAAFIDLQSWLIQIPLDSRAETSKIFEIRKL